MEAVFWGGLLRFGEAALAGAPTLLVGLFVAGVFRKLIGEKNTLKLFGGTGWRSLPQSWLWGMLLPVCSIGVIPVAYELRRAGLRGGSILAFALTAPLFNPLSLLYGLTLSTPFVILAFAFGSLIVVTVVGLLWDRFFPTRRSRFWRQKKYRQVCGEWPRSQLLLRDTWRGPPRYTQPSDWQAAYCSSPFFLLAA